MDTRHTGRPEMEYEALLLLLRSRRSIRQFVNRPVGRDDLNRILEAARWAPSNHNRQPWRFLVLEDPAGIQRLAAEVRAGLTERLRTLPDSAQPYATGLIEHSVVFGRAPILILALHQQPVRVAAAVLEGVAAAGLISGEPLSVAMAVQNLLLAASALGLGACVLTAPLLARDRLAGVVQLPPGFDLTCFIALGHPDESPDAPRRKSLELIAEFGNPLSLAIHNENK